MKKFISIVLSLVMVLSVAAASTAVYAAPSVQSITGKPDEKNPISTEVNGNESDDIKVTKENDEGTIITFEYEGEGEVSKWEFPGLTPGQDYKIISQSGNKITIELLNGYEGEVVANAIVKDSSSKGKSKNNKKKSPKTGASALAATAVAGAGVAILAATKKRDED